MLHDLESALAADDLARLSGLGHSAKGMVSLFAAADATAAALKVEKQPADSAPADRQKAVTDLRRELERLSRFLADALPA